MISFKAFKLPRLLPLTSTMAVLLSQIQTASADSIWSGTVSSDWTDATNWSNPPAYGATISDRLVIDNGTGLPAIYDPVAQNAATDTNFIMPNGSDIPALTIGNTTSGSLTINSGTLTLKAGSTSTAPATMAVGQDAALTVNGGILDVTGVSSSGGDQPFKLVTKGREGLTSDLTINGGQVIGNSFDLFANSDVNTGSSSIHFAGGTFSASLQRTAITGTATSTVIFNGGTLETKSNLSYVSLPALYQTRYLVQAGGIKIVNQAMIYAQLEHDPALGTTPDGGLTKSGADGLILTNKNTYTGPTLIEEGGIIFIEAGSLEFSPITVASGASFRTSVEGSSFKELHLADGVHLSLPAKINSSVTIHGTLELNGGTITVSVENRGPLPSGTTVDLLTADNISGTANFVPNFSPYSSFTGTISINGNKVQLHIENGSKDLVWNPIAPSTTWDLSAPNFLDGTSRTVFHYEDSVTFDDSITSSNRTVKLTSGVFLSGLTVNNSTGAYTFNTSPLSGSGTFVKRGSSDLIFQDVSHSFYYMTGPIIIGGTGKVDFAYNLITRIPVLTLDGGTLTNASISANKFDIRSGTCTARLGGSGYLRKTTSGFAKLKGNGTNSVYTGDTFIEEGTLSVEDYYFTDASKISITTGAILSLDRTPPDAVAGLIIDGISLPPGVYGSSSSGAPSPDDVHFSGPGMLVVMPPGSAYDLWATSNLLSASNRDKTADPNGNGMNNFGEYAFAGNPLSQTPNPRIVCRYATVYGKNTLVFTVPLPSSIYLSSDLDMYNNSPVNGVYYRIQASTDLVNWGTVLKVASIGSLDLPAVQTGIPAAPTGWTNRSFYVVNPPADITKCFLRAKASEAP